MTKCEKNWFAKSNRWKHFALAVPVGFFLTVLCAVGCASGMEFKDRQWGGQWDWLDWLCTVAGGIVGQALQAFVLVEMFKPIALT